MKRTFLATILVLALCATSAFAIENPFTDVDSTDDMAQSVMWALENGITSGTTETTFSPDETCTRGQVVTFLWRANGEGEATITENPFTDVDEDSAYYNAILWAVGEGITTGMTETTFEPNTTCSSAQVITFLYRALGEPEAETESELADGVATAYAPAINWADEIALLEGMDFVAADASPRSDIVTYLWIYAGAPEVEITEAEVTEEEVVEEEEIVEEEVVEEEEIVEEEVVEEEVIEEEDVIVEEEVIEEEVVEEEEVVVEDTSDLSIAEQMLVLINECRAEGGLDPLALEETIQAAADIRAVELATLYSHYRPDGSSCFGAMIETGANYGWKGENIASGQTSVEQVMTAWINSSGHYANIMGVNYTVVGIGNYGTYWVQMFGG